VGGIVGVLALVSQPPPHVDLEAGGIVCVLVLVSQPPPHVDLKAGGGWYR
jgi:hypothetical protein